MRHHTAEAIAGCLRSYEHIPRCLLARLLYILATTAVSLAVDDATTTTEQQMNSGDDDDDVERGRRGNGRERDPDDSGIRKKETKRHMQQRWVLALDLSFNWHTTNRNVGSGGNDNNGQTCATNLSPLRETDSKGRQKNNGQKNNLVVADGAEIFSETCSGGRVG